MPEPGNQPAALPGDAPPPPADHPEELKAFASMAAELRGFGKMLQGAPLQIAQPVPGLPVSIEEARSFTKNYRTAPAYLLDKNLNIVAGNSDAKKFVDFEALPEGKSAWGFVNYIAEHFLPERSAGRSPREDYKNQQLLRSLLTGVYQLPDVELVLAISKYRDRPPNYQTVKINVQPLFSREEEFFGILCRLQIKKLDEEAYLKHLQDDEMVFPLPEDIVDMVQTTYGLQRKALQQVQEAARLKAPVAPESEPPVIDLSTLPTKEDLKKLFNFEAFEKAVEGLGDSVEDKELMRLADAFIRDELRQIIQRKIKLTLWGEEIPGTVTFNTYLRDEDHGYVRAQIGKKPTHTAPIRSLTSSELKEFKEQLAERQATHQERVAESTTAKNRSRS